jgi:hypothetical protein
LSDPDHLTTTQIDNLYAHWLGRQRKGLQAFVILNASPLHAASIAKKLEKSKASKKGKGKAKAYVEVGNSDESAAEDGNPDPGDGSDEEEERDDPPLKIGPPIGSRKMPSGSEEHASPEAGPSKTRDGASGSSGKGLAVNLVSFLKLKNSHYL